MKHLFFSALLLLAMSGVYSQVKTSIEDFTYITMTLREDIMKGRGVKAGYSLEDIGEQYTRVGPNGKPIKIGLMYFKKGETKVAIVIAASTYSKMYGRAWCIPTMDSDTEVWNAAYKTFVSAGEDWSAVAMWGMSKAMSLKLL